MIKWIKTDKHVYGTIYREHIKDLTVFGTCSAPEGNLELGLISPYMLTEWGFKKADEPLIKSIATKKNRHQEEYDYEYFIAMYIDDGDLGDD